MNSVHDIGSVNNSFTTNQNEIVVDEEDDGKGVVAGGETISSVQFAIVLLPALELLLQMPMSVSNGQQVIIQTRGVDQEKNTHPSGQHCL